MESPATIFEKNDAAFKIYSTAATLEENVSSSSATLLSAAAVPVFSTSQKAQRKPIPKTTLGASWKTRTTSKDENIRSWLKKTPMDSSAGRPGTRRTSLWALTSRSKNISPALQEEDPWRTSPSSQDQDAERCPAAPEKAATGGAPPHDQDADRCPAVPKRDALEGTISSTPDPETTYHPAVWRRAARRGMHFRAQGLDATRCPSGQRDIGASESSAPPRATSPPQASLPDPEESPGKSDGTTEVRPTEGEAGEDDRIYLEYLLPTGLLLCRFCLPVHGVQTLSKHFRKTYNKLIAFRCSRCDLPFETQKKYAHLLLGIVGVWVGAPALESSHFLLGQKLEGIEAFGIEHREGLMSEDQNSRALFVFLSNIKKQSP
ncbi:serine/threonine-protein kinase OSR1 [Platysternon megacephalum]|uniref:Serine/threonine-protein kinase OSR1 n=1 Tax=Platysternon megacephalum TaxID=55544 RepID=A0A4D9ECV8_9SAUR|nr:serine/threonine-protein kinase OSR1 [Platysternon megacephalum]